MVDEGFEIKAKGVGRKPLSKDTNAEAFWSDFDNICKWGRLEYQNKYLQSAKVKPKSSSNCISLTAQIKHSSKRVSV